MRYDIKEITKQMNKDNIKPVYSKVAKQYNCDYRTIKNHLIGEYDEKRKRGKIKLNAYEEFIEIKLKENCSY